MTRVINFFGGPCTGKSTMAAAVFSELKWAGINTELVTEYAKELIWDGTPIKDQFMILGQQYHRLKRLENKVDYIVTDSPLLLSIYYSRGISNISSSIIYDYFEEFENINFLMGREDKYTENGRNHSLEQALVIDTELLRICSDLDTGYIGLKNCRSSIYTVFTELARNTKVEEEELKWQLRARLKK